MNKLLSMAVGAVMVSVMAVSNVLATYEYGQIASGDIYRVRNVTDNQTEFVPVANADLCETVQFKLRVHNGGPKTVTNVNVKATLSSGVSTSHSSTATITADNNREGAVATGTAGVTLSKAGSISYVSGSTELLDANGAKIRILGDTLFTSGVNIGDVAVSLNNKRFVQFKATTNCEPVVKHINVCELATKKIITIKESDFDASKHSKNLDDCKEVVKKIKVCEVATKKIITIDEKNFDASMHSKNLADCAEKPPVPGEIVVCETATKEIVTIKENEFDAEKHTRDLSKCDVTPVTPETPAELPQTGAEGAAAIIVTLLTAGIGYLVTARRNVLG